MEYLDLFYGLALYAETHFKFFKGMPSFLFKKEPEIIFDVPARIFGTKLPVVLLINDKGKFPLEIKNCTILLTQKGFQKELFNDSKIQRFTIKTPFNFKRDLFLLELHIPENISGYFLVNCKLTITDSRGKEKVILNDNYRTSTKKSFLCFKAETPLPGSKKSLYGDLHVHSHFTESHVELALPISILDIAAKISGLDFLAITDHSYDLSCSIENYLEPSKNLERWTEFKHELASQKFETIIIPGEEVSVLNSHGKCVHLSLLENKKFVHGDSDGARQVFKSKKDKSIAEVIHHDSYSVAFASHPGSNPGIMQSLFLKRGHWTINDIKDETTFIMQALNNNFGSDWYNAKKLWIKSLIKGKKISIVAGNDSHGDLNRYRFLKIPFLLIGEDENRFLGKAKTGVYIDENMPRNKEHLITSIRAGKTFVTTGPYINMTDSENGKSLISNTPLSLSEQKSINVVAESTSEFGKIANIRIFFGKIGLNEKLFKLFGGINTYDFAYNLELYNVKGNSYIRVELESYNGDSNLFYKAASSPLYLA